MKKPDTASKTRSKPKFQNKKITAELRALDDDELSLVEERGLSGCLFLLSNFQHYSELLDRKLRNIDEQHISEIERYEREARDETGELGNAGPPMDLVTSIRALDAIQEHFVDLGIASDAVERLRVALVAVISGNPPPMFLGPPLDHRPIDAPKIQEIKGILASAMGEYQRRKNLSRTDAAKAVLRNIPPDLEAQLSNGPITARTIIGWYDRFGGANSLPSLGQKSYQIFKKAFSNNPDSHDKYVQLLIAEYAKILPNL